jgi:glycosyltransferase involved in cell wall biosynthesis
VIGNPLEDTIPPVERCMQHREPHTYVYSATWDRGGDIALRVFRKIRDSVFPERATLHIASYHDSIPPEVANETGVIVHGSLDKNELYELLVSTETMLYPSFSATGSIHRDTFSCTVCEAIACGCRVISYAHGALAELYSGIVEFVEVPREHQASLDSFYYLEDPWFATDEAIDGFARMASMKEGTRDEYITLIRDRYSAKRIGAEWSNLLSGGRNA